MTAKLYQARLNGALLQTGTVSTTQIADGTIQAADVQTGQLPTLLATSGVLGSSQATIPFSSISGAFTSLELRILGKSTAAVVAENVKIQLNGVSSGYYNQYMAGTGTTAANASEALNVTAGEIGIIPGASSSPAGFLGVVTAWLHGYAIAGNFKIILGLSYAGWGTVATNQQVLLKGTTVTGVTAAVTSLTLLPSTGQWTAGTIAQLYGHP